MSEFLNNPAVSGMVLLIILGIGGVLVKVITLWSAKLSQLIDITSQQAAKIEAAAVTAAKVKEDVADVKTQAAVIVGHVNSEKTAAQGREAVLRKENDLLRETLEENKKATALLAQSTAIKQPAALEHTTPSALAQTVSNGMQKHLEKIEDNTEQTAKNTAL